MPLRIPESDWTFLGQDIEGTLNRGYLGLCLPKSPVHRRGRTWNIKRWRAEGGHHGWSGPKNGSQL